jgi:hypothetical protein
MSLPVCQPKLIDQGTIRAVGWRDNGAVMLVNDRYIARTHSGNDG